VGASFAATNATGTRASSQSMGLRRISLSRGFTCHLSRFSTLEINMNRIVRHGPGAANLSRCEPTARLSVEGHGERIASGSSAQPGSEVANGGQTFLAIRIDEGRHEEDSGMKKTVGDDVKSVDRSRDARLLRIVNKRVIRVDIDNAPPPCLECLRLVLCYRPERELGLGERSRRGRLD
jgi:hypothetical protein